MPQPGQPFKAVEQVTLNAAGGGQVTLSPPGVDWQITLASCSTSTRVKEPVFKLYMDGTSDANFLEGTYSGSQDATDTPHYVPAGSQLIGVWTGGDAGARATLRVTGTVAG